MRMPRGGSIPIRLDPQRGLAPEWHEALLLLICLGIIAFQTFVPPYIGIADNGDFAKVAGRLSLGPADSDHSVKYFNADYVRSRRYYWVSPVYSSELWPATLASLLSHTDKEGDVFNIRWLGAVHVSIFVVSFYLFLLAIRPMGVWPAFILGSAAIYLFTDVLYVAYFNSFYSDTAALLGLLGATVLAVFIITRGTTLRLLIAFSLFAILLIASKSQHALWGFLPTLFLFTAARHLQRRVARVIGFALVALLLGADFYVVETTPRDYRGQALFNLIFFKIAKNSPDPAQDLVDLGLSRKELPYIGMYVYRSDAPSQDPKWFQEFCGRTDYFKVAGFYVRKPSRVFGILRDDLRINAPYLRFAYANFRRQDASKPQQMAERFASWSNLRGGLFFLWPEHILIWYTLLVAGAAMILCSAPTGTATRMAWLAMGLAAAAAIEFCVASLADAVETFRHLFVFHALTDLTVLLALAALLAGTLPRMLASRFARA